MGSQYLLANDDSPETNTVKFEHCEVELEIHKTFYILPIGFCRRFIKYLPLQIKIFFDLYVMSCINLNCIYIKSDYFFIKFLSMCWDLAELILT